MLGHIQNMAFELQSNNIQRRDHIRLWDTHTTFQGSEVWLGCAVYDNGIELSRLDLIPTHHISPAVDKEREIVAQSLEQNALSLQLLQYSKPDLLGLNAARDYYFTDGNIQIVELDHSYLFQPQITAAYQIKDGLFWIMTNIVNFFVSTNLTNTPFFNIHL